MIDSRYYEYQARISAARGNEEELKRIETDIDQNEEPGDSDVESLMESLANVRALDVPEDSR